MNRKSRNEYICQVAKELVLSYYTYHHDIPKGIIQDCVQRATILAETLEYQDSAPWDEGKRTW